jgi:hypothetical protein
VQAHERAVDVAGRVPVRDLLEDLDAVQFVAVDGGGQEHPRPVLGAVDDRDRDLDGVTEVGFADLVPELALLAGLDFRVEPERRGFVWCHTRRTSAGY